jgi:hypothetical protein
VPYDLTDWANGSGGGTPISATGTGTFTDSGTQARRT